MGGGGEYLLVDPEAQLKEWERQLVKTQVHCAGSGVAEQRLVEALVMNVSWLRQEVKKVSTESGEIKVMSVSRHELSYLILTIILRLHNHSHFEDEGI